MRRRKKSNIYRKMEIASSFVMGYGILQMAAVEEVAKAVSETSMMTIVIGISFSLAIITLGFLMGKLFRGLRIMETREWKEDEKRVLRRAS